MALTLIGSWPIPYLTMNPKKFSEETPKAHFKGVHLQFILSAFDEDFPYIIYIVMGLMGLYNDVNLHILKAIMEHVIENDSYQALVGSISILKTGQHDFVMEICHGNPECDLLASKGSISIWS